MRLAHASTTPSHSGNDERDVMRAPMASDVFVHQISIIKKGGERLAKSEDTRRDSDEPESHRESPMWMKTIVLVAALGAASIDFANAQSVDPDPADRGYPAYAQPNFSGYYMGVPQGRAAAAAPAIGHHQSRPAALRHHRRAR
jgi:hypothetical protein